MTAGVAAALFVLAMLDGAFAGFRSSAGRTGLIRHRQSDYQAARRGAGLAGALLAPVILLVCADTVTRPAHLDDYARAGTAMLAMVRDPQITQDTRNHFADGPDSIRKLPL